MKYSSDIGIDHITFGAPVNILLSRNEETHLTTGCYELSEERKYLVLRSV